MSAFLESVDSARAMWRGMLLVGHRRTVRTGVMQWALPGGGNAMTEILAAAGDFEVLNCPTQEEITAYVGDAA